MAAASFKISLGGVAPFSSLWTKVLRDSHAWDCHCHMSALGKCIEVLKANVLAIVLTVPQSLPVCMEVVILWHECLMTLGLGKIRELGFGEFKVGEDMRRYLVLLPVFCWASNSCLQFKQTCVKPLPANSTSVWVPLTLLSKPHHPRPLEHL